MDSITGSESEGYCYNQNVRMEWKYMWSTVQVKITSSGLLRIVHITERHKCQYPESIITFIKCVIHNFWMPKETNELTIIVNSNGETACFSVNPVRNIFVYTVKVNSKVMAFKLFLVFAVGIFLFFYAKTLSQSPILYYSSGTMLDVLMMLIFVLLLVKRYIPKYSMFGAVMVGCWFASVYVPCQLMEELIWLWYANRIYVSGYILIVGFFSFAVYYKHGTLVDKRSINLLTWTLHFFSLVLTYSGVHMPQARHHVLRSSSCPPEVLCCPLKAVSYLCWKVKKWFASEKLVVEYLTEEEYREQADAEMASALEDLCQACCRPDFPSWLAVSRLQAPKKFDEVYKFFRSLEPG